MPVVPDAPQIASTAPQITPFQAGGVQAPQNYAGRQIGQLGAAMTAVAAEQLRSAEFEQQRIDRARTRIADANAWSEDSEGLANFESLNGLQAVDSYEGAIESYDKRTEEVAKGLDNDFQREAFIIRRMERRERYVDRARGHRQKQLEQADIQANQGEMDIDRQEGIELSREWSGQDPQGKGDEARKSAEKVRAGATQLAEKMGVPEAKRDQFVQAELTKLHKGIVEQMIVDGNVAGASAYLAANRGRGEIVSEVATDLQKQVQAAQAAMQKAIADDAIDSKAFFIEAELREAGYSLVDMQSYLTGVAKNGDLTPIEVDAVMKRAKANAESFSSDERRIDTALLSEVDDAVLAGFENGTFQLTSRPGEILDGLPQSGTIKDRHLRARAVKSIRSMRLTRLADSLANDPTFEFVTEMVQNQKDITETIENLKEIKADLRGMKDLDDGERTRRESRIDGQIKLIEDLGVELSKRVSNELNEFNRLHSRSPLGDDEPMLPPPPAATRSLVEPPKKTAEQKAEDARIFAERLKALRSTRPGGGR